MKLSAFEEKAGNLLSVLGNPIRIRILMALGEEEACVCHLEALLGQRQAFISQHLMALRSAGLLKTRRDGKYVYYRLASPEITGLIQDAARIAGLERDQLPEMEGQKDAVLKKCVCPHCENEKLALGKL